MGGGRKNRNGSALGVDVRPGKISWGCVWGGDKVNGDHQGGWKVAKGLGVDFVKGW